MKTKTKLIIVALVILGMIVASIVWGIITVNRNKRKHLIPDILDRYNSEWGQMVAELDEALLADGQLTENNRALIDSMLDSYEAGSDNALRLAVYTLTKTKNGYPEEAARQRLTDQVNAMDIGKYSYKRTTLESLFTEAPWTLEPVFERFRIHWEHDSLVRDLLKVIAEYIRSRLPLEERVRWAMAVENTSFTSAQFLALATTDDELPELRALILETTDPNQLSLLAKMLSENPSQPKDIIPILYHFRQQDQSLAELFPDGVRLNVDLSSLNRQDSTMSDQQPPADSRYLIISRTEKEVKAEQLKKKPSAGYSCNKKTDPSTFDVRVETAWMDQVPLEQMPATYEDCQWLVVADTQYIYDGCISELEDYATGQKESGKYFYPVYGVLQRLMLVECDSLEPKYLINIQSTDAMKDQTVIRWTNVSVGTSVSRYSVIPRFDSAWKDDAIQQFLNLN